ncbi:MAG: hypothetical protein BWY57_00812 [Betaproteobacteria bacterium ADurb.Bin341]|nr:MAG: hypothetical protein BWY57_00812 [Betaproteobacteria bacterium ADurb.Bin341]
MKTISIGSMIRQISGLSGTKDVTEWESGFIANIVDKTFDGRDTTMLTGKQVETVERIYSKHFA